ncbi:MAG: hypothetical protein ACRC2K_03995 [Clostridium sp.]
MKIIKNIKEINKEDLGFEDDILHEGFTDEPLSGNAIKTFDFNEFKVKK